MKLQIFIVTWLSLAFQLNAFYTQTTLEQNIPFYCRECKPNTVPHCKDGNRIVEVSCAAFFKSRKELEYNDKHESDKSQSTKSTEQRQSWSTWFTKIFTGIKSAWNSVKRMFLNDQVQYDHEPTYSSNDIDSIALARQPTLEEISKPTYIKWPETGISSSQRAEMSIKIDEMISMKPKNETIKEFIKKVSELSMIPKSKKRLTLFKGIHKLLKEALKVFKEKADKTLMNEKDVARAASCAWTMLFNQAIHGIPIRLTESIYGYSMLYPLTDDLMDNQTINIEDRKAFAKRFARLISHGDSKPENPQEEKIWYMFSLIEKEWDRKLYPTKYRFLLELLIAQKDSQLQFGIDGNPPPFDKVWEVTVRKGALSGLCGLALVKEIVTKEDAIYASSLGTISQYLNDLKGIDDDIKENQYTPFSLVYLSGKVGNLDGITDFVLRNIHESYVYNGDLIKSNTYKSLESIFAMKLTFGVAVNQEKFSSKFIAKIESISPISLNKMKWLKSLE